MLLESHKGIVASQVWRLHEMQVVSQRRELRVVKTIKGRRTYFSDILVER